MRKMNYKILSLGLLIACAGCAAENEKVNIITGSFDEPEVIPPLCPDWTDPDNGSNFGCANITNYGQMIEDPNDMIVGRGTSLTNAARAGIPVSIYEAGPISTAPAGGGSSNSSGGGSSESQ